VKHSDLFALVLRVGHVRLSCPVCGADFATIKAPCTRLGFTRRVQRFTSLHAHANGVELTYLAPAGITAARTIPPGT